MDFNNLTDEQLVQKAQNKEKGAMEAVIVRHKHLVNKVIRSIIFNESDVTDDLVQEGTIGLVRAVESFDDTKASFVTYASTCIKSSTRDAWRKLNSKKEQVLNNSILFSALVDGETGKSEIVIDHSVNPETEYINKELEQELIQGIKNTLSKLEYGILTMYLQGYKYSEIGQEFDKSIKSVDNAIQRIRTKVNKLTKTLRR
jgi:RNA polymerase sporulation-specific sigma factor